MIRVVASDLDQLIWYHRIESMTPEELVARFRRETKMGWEADAGHAWHDLLETWPGCEMAGTITHMGFNFMIEADGTLALPQVAEVRGQKVYSIDGYDIEIRARCDGLSGNKIQEYKLTGRPNPESMMESFQWKVYLDIFDASVAEYSLFQRSGKPPNLTIRAIETFRLYRYRNMRHDIEQAIRDYLRFAERWMPEILETEND